MVEKFLLNCLAVECPELTEEWHPTKNLPLTPVTVSYGANKRVWWQCKTCNHEWVAYIHLRRKQYKPKNNKGTGCPNCAGMVITPENSFAGLNPVAAKEWHPIKNDPITPDQVAPHSTKKYWWLCSICENEWEACPTNRTCGADCPKCGEFKNRKEPIKKWGKLMQDMILVSKRKNHGK